MRVRHACCVHTLPMLLAWITLAVQSPQPLSLSTQVGQSYPPGACYWIFVRDNTSSMRATLPTCCAITRCENAHLPQHAEHVLYCVHTWTTSTRIPLLGWRVASLLSGRTVCGARPRHYERCANAFTLSHALVGSREYTPVAALLAAHTRAHVRGTLREVMMLARNDRH